MKEHPFQAAALILLTLPEFHGVLNGILDQKLKPLLDALQSGVKLDQAEYLTTEQALRFLHLSKPTLNKLRLQAVITGYNSSDKRVLYKRSELVAYLEAAKQKGGKAA